MFEPATVAQSTLQRPMDMLKSGRFWAIFVDEVTLHNDFLIGDGVSGQTIPAKTVTCNAVVVAPEHVRPFLSVVHAEHDQAVSDWRVSGLHFGEMLNRKNRQSEFAHLHGPEDNARVEARVRGVAHAIADYAEVVIMQSADPSSVQNWRGQTLWKSIPEPFRHLPGDYAKWAVLRLVNQFIKDKRRVDNQVGIVLMDRFDHEGHFLPNTRMTPVTGTGTKCFDAFAGGTVHFVGKTVPAMAAAADLACYTYARHLHDLTQGKVEPRFQVIHEAAELIRPRRWSLSPAAALVSYEPGKRNKQILRRLTESELPRP